LAFCEKKRAYILCAIGVLWFFALLTGLAPSVFRATLMFSFLGFGQLLGRRFFSLNALLVSGLFLLMLDANTLFDIGFQLSFMALLGILFFFQPIADLWKVRNKWLDKLWQGTALGLAAQIGTVPISLYYFHQFPNYFMLTNIGLILVSGVALGGVLLFFITSKVPVINDVVALALEYVFGAMASFVRWIDQLPFSVARGFAIESWQVWVAYGSLIVLLIAYRSQRLRLWYGSVLIVFLCALQFVYVRHTSEFKQEAVVFNSPTPLVLVKNKGVNYFLHTVKTEDELKKLDFIVSAYERKYSGSTKYIPIEENQLVEIAARSESIALLKWHMNGLHVLVDDSEVLIPLEDRYVNPDSTAVVLGSWLKSPQVESGYQLEQGALYWK
jgi:competence protein ComEC